MKRTIMLLLLPLMITATVGCKKLLNPRVKYFVDGTATTYTVQYKDANGALVNLDTVGYNWSVSFEAKKDDPLLLTAKAHETDSWVKVYVYIDGKLLKSDYQFGDTLTARIEDKVRLVF